MPYLIKHLGHIKKASARMFRMIETTNDVFNNSELLVDSGMTFPKTKLLFRNDLYRTRERKKKLVNGLLLSCLMWKYMILPRFRNCKNSRMLPLLRSIIFCLFYEIFHLGVRNGMGVLSVDFILGRKNLLTSLTKRPSILEEFGLS